MKKTYLRLHFSSEGDSPLEVIRQVKEAVFKPMVGDYDFFIEYGTPQDFGRLITGLHDALRGSGVIYTLTTKEE